MSTSADRGDAPRLIGSYSSYEEAQRAVDTLSDRGFPVETATIVGSDLRLVERVTGRRTVARAALAGAGSGAWFGLLVGLVFWIVSPWAVGAVVSGVLLGLAFGAVFAAIAQAVTGGRRDFTSFRTLEAARFDLLVDDLDAGEQALRILSQPALSDDQESTTAAHRGKDLR